MAENALLQVPEGTGEETVKLICSSFEKMLGKELTFRVAEKKDLMGGFIAKIDGTTYDNSVSSRLARMKKYLMKK